MKNYTISDIAKHCGVSKTTVSRVLNNVPYGISEQKRKEILDYMQEINYRPNNLARSVSTSRTNIVGLIIPDVSNYFFSIIVRNVCNALEERGYSLLIATSNSNAKREQQLLMGMVDTRVAGIIFCSGASNSEFLKSFVSYKIPLVAIGRGFDIEYFDASVRGDNYYGAELAIQHLIDHNNKKFVYIDGNINFSGVMQRNKAADKIFFDNDIPKKNIHKCFGPLTIEHGYDSIYELLKQNIDFDAVFCGSDLIAMGVLEALAEKNIKVPDEVEVMGFDDIDINRMSLTKLSTIYKPHDQMAVTAVEMLEKIINKQPLEERHVIVQPRLVIRQTTRSGVKKDVQI